jgi:hypothetical protein
MDGTVPVPVHRYCIRRTEDQELRTRLKAERNITNFKNNYNKLIDYLVRSSHQPNHTARPLVVLLLQG